ncbi:hypothetical protein ASF60_21855 [Methylobacterium sp. Leaf113]|jgi:hypothetical protein|uniref:hypothetical protein n=1 Tax=Methylobacterium sp. Leaf113 TaxID=1736259 RepID=UPI0006FDFE94|nr:hypothetical protein [Methylobacterium sp. Leaf113]KQP85337.1 hypothetical protein ASF60_21855 [Methylobacterium sp. Leaf113]
MRRSLPLTLALIVFAAGPALAQAPAGPPRPATTWITIEEPMSTLLNGGHRIVSASGPSFTLERGGKYVVCEVRPAGGMRGAAETTSTCHRVN